MTDRDVSQGKPLEDQDGRAVAAFMLGDAAIAAWLWYALQSFGDHPGIPWPRVLGPAVAAALLAFALRAHRPSPGRPARALLKAAGVGAALAALASIPWVGAWLRVSTGQGLWLGAAVGGLIWLERSVYFGTVAGGPGHAQEVLRWIAVGAAATLAMTPFYYSGALGSGDAQWYTIMLGDFVTQLRAGVFPVWVGQSAYAFNGAVSPLRYAPGFQYAGGILDLLTLRSLELTALRNAELAVTAIVGAYSAYACLRSILRSAPWVACALAVLWIAGPGVLAPPLVGDQFMTFMTLPFVPLTLHGCWRVWQKGDRWGRLWIAAGLAGSWICHSPIALWLTVIAACLYLPVFLKRRPWSREFRLAVFLAAAFLILGAEPFVSVLTLDNQITSQASAVEAAKVIHANFPANFRPINPDRPGLADYQLGYALLGTLLLSLGLVAGARQRVAWGFAAATILIVPVAVPVPWLTNAIWHHLPGWFVTIQNVWPMQRLFLVWSSLIVFTAAIVIASRGTGSRRGPYAALLAFFACGIAWSGREAYRMERGIYPMRSTPQDTRVAEGLDNLQLSRYAYASFSYTPSYYSHAYMDPWLENRLLDVRTMEAFVSNANYAAPAAGDPGIADSGSQLVQSGAWTGASVTSSEYYRLKPDLLLEPGRRYALRLDFAQPGIQGFLQLKTRSMFREYMLPDSGTGIMRQGPSLAFGSGPVSSHVFPLAVNEPGPVEPTGMFIAARYAGENLPFARFWLYAYERDRLPIYVESWIPYRARVTAPRTAYLETPRMWLKGWRATVNGRWTATIRSPENLVMIPVGAGVSHVTLTYSPPFVLKATFWVGALGWAGLGAGALWQLALWSGGSRLRFGWLRTPGWLGLLLDAALAPLVLARRRKLATLAVAAAAAALAIALHMRASHAASLEAVGPIRVQFTRPAGFLGFTQPILTTGQPGAGTVVSVSFVDKDHARIGADVWGTLFQSAPMEMPYGVPQSLIVSDSALFPLSNPKVRALQPSEAERLRAEIRVELNGRVAIDAPAYAFETTPAEVLAGEAPFGSTADRKFAGEILKVERIPTPRTLVLPAGFLAHMRLVFPRDASGRSEPLLSVSSGRNRRACYATYLAAGRIRLTCWGPGGVPAKSAELTYDPKAAHDLDFIPGEAPEVPASFDVACEFDGVHVFGHERIPSPQPPVVVSGLNPFEAPGVDVRFTGPQMDVDLRSRTAKAGDEPETSGPFHLVVRFPPRKPGRQEPLLSTGHTGAGDFVYVVYADDGHVRIGFDHWAVGGGLSAPIAVDYGAPHELWISMGSLFPGADDDRAWRGLDPNLRRSLAGQVDVRLDGKAVLSLQDATYPSAAGEVTVARNAIGGSTSDPEFSGTVIYAERTGPLPLPAPGK
jgi:hypothetical protein